MEMMVKGERTALTYKVKTYRYGYTYLRCRVYEPYLRRRWFGLLPPTLAYRYARDTGGSAELASEHPTPADVQSLGELAVRVYEEYKLAWEKP